MIGIPSRARWPQVAVAGRLVLRTFAWLVAAAIGSIAFFRLTHLDGWFPITIVSASAPVMFLLAYPLLAAAGWRRDRPLVVAAAVCVLCHLWWFGAMLPVLHSDRTLPAGAARVRVLSANLLAENTRAADIAQMIEKTSPDIVALQEYTWRTADVLGPSAAMASYPYRVVDPTWSPDGIALFSRLPLIDSSKLTLGGRKALRAQVRTAAGPVTVLVAHTVAPVDAASNDDWQDQLQAIGTVARTTEGPLIVAADLNATPGNRQLADLADKAHIRDVLDATGSGYDMTWPANRSLLPSFVRPDHVLAGRGALPLRGHTFHVTGSDHRGIVADIGVTGPR